jgi:hypothetical protein
MPSWGQNAPNVFVKNGAHQSAPALQLASEADVVHAASRVYGVILPAATVYATFTRPHFTHGAPGYPEQGETPPPKVGKGQPRRTKNLVDQTGVD